MSELHKFLKEYKKKIEEGKIPLDDNYTCKVCKEEFHYRPISCRVICNDCMEVQEEFVVLGHQVRDWKGGRLR